MARLLKVSEAASLALHAAGLLASAEDRPATTRSLAEELRASEAHLSKVMQRLERAGLVKGRRGPGGGFQLAKPADRISLRDICEAIEGRYESSDCPFSIPVCGGGALAEEFKIVTDKLLRFLEKTKLSAWRMKVNKRGATCSAQSCGRI